MSSPFRHSTRKSQQNEGDENNPMMSRPVNSRSGSNSRPLASRNSNTQPSYDFLSGGAISPQPAQKRSVRQDAPHTAQEHGNEDLKAQIRALQYEVSTFKQERELTELRHEGELRDAQKRAEADFKRAQASESESHVATQKYDAVVKELRETQDQSAGEKAELEKRVRSSQERTHSLEEELEDIRTELSSRERQTEYQVKELDTRCVTLQRTSQELRNDLGVKASDLQNVQKKLLEKEADIGHLENEILRLKAQSGDADTLGVIKRELSDQVTHIKKLESVNRDYAAEIKHFKKVHKSVEVVEEEKRSLESKLSLMDDLERELSEAQLRRQRLEDERSSWSTYLESEGQQQEFESPEKVAKALVQARIENASLIERLGGIEPQVLEKDDLIQSLESEKSKLRQELDKARPSSGSGSSETKARARLERQRALALKEVEYLRAQLSTFDSDETIQDGGFDEQKAQRIRELEGIVDEYRQELQSVNEQLAKREEIAADLKSAGTKRAAEEEPNERAGQMSRKLRKLQEEMSSMSQSKDMLERELSASKTQLTSLQQSSRTRILEMRSNPTAEAVAIKTSTLTALREENAALLERLEKSLRSNPTHAQVPLQTLENARMDLKGMENSVASKDKHMLRLKQIWTAKSQEFREAVASVLGYKLDFMPNGRVRVTSMFYSKPSGEDADDAENSIIFDGENGTMKISGGPNSAFAHEIRGLIRFWVEERKEIPCFLAAMTLEFYEKTTRAARM